MNETTEYLLNQTHSIISRLELNLNTLLQSQLFNQTAQIILDAIAKAQEYLNATIT
jgi:hypothetical protein